MVAVDAVIIEVLSSINASTSVELPMPVLAPIKAIG
jgi:hypothetical protein